MFDDQSVWNQFLLYQIESDLSAEYETEKIVFYSENITAVLFEEDNSSLYGMYGQSKNLEDQINLSYPENAQFKFKEEFLCKPSGKIVVAQKKCTIIFCLILPLEFFLKRPINEKAIELTLYRILSDIVQTIIVCPDDKIFEQWYEGENVPFSEQHSTIMHKYKIEQNNQEKLEYKEVELNSLISEGYNNWKFIPVKNHDQQFICFNQTVFTNQDYESVKIALFYIMQQVILNIFKHSQNKFNEYCKKYLKQEYFTQKLIDQLDKAMENSQKEIKKLLEDIRQRLMKKLQSMQLQSNIKNIEDQITLTLINRLKNNLLVKSNGFFGYDYKDDFFPQEVQKVKIFNLVSDFHELKKLCLNKLDEILLHFQENKIPDIVAEFKKDSLQEINKIACSKCKFSVIRQLNNGQQIEKLSLVNSSQFTLDLSDLKTGLFGGVQQLIMIDLFFTNSELNDILILQKEKKTLIVSLRNNGKAKLLRCIDNIVVPCFLFLQQQKLLFGFNHCTRDVIKWSFSSASKIDEVIFHGCQSQLLTKVIYLIFSGSFIGLTSDGCVSQWKGNHDPFYQIQALKFDSKNNSQKTEFRPSYLSKNSYNQLEACPSGKKFFLSNSYVIDIYDECHELIKSVQLKGKLMFFTDLSDAFIVAVDDYCWKNQIKSGLMFPNLSNRQQIKQVDADDIKNKKQGNPFFDIFRGSQVKYGPVQTFLLQNDVKKITLQIVNARERVQKISKYMKLIKINKTCQFNFVNDAQLQGIINDKTFKVNKMLYFTYTRVPMQFCTIENNQLIPLVDGFRQVNNCNQRLSILQRAKLLKLGYIEEYLMNLDQKIFVVSIIGKQSSGKSYLLNRLFGTRFSVAASRCTDGIWASITHINDQKYLILDCEGLFSKQRTKVEETQLLAFLSGLSDITILNQDLSFNRQLDELLDDLTTAVERLKGDSLFKGALLIALRDVSRNDSFGAKEQLLENIETNLSKRNSTFLNALFSNSFNIFIFSYFEDQNFPDQIENLRKNFVQMAITCNHWLTGRDLIQKIKILLIQLETQDSENTDQLHFQFQIEDIFEKIKNSWSELETDEKFCYNNQQFLAKNYKLWRDKETGRENLQAFFEELIQQISVDLSLNLTINKHNSNLIVIQSFLSELVQHRKMVLQKDYDKIVSHIKFGSYEQEVVKNEKILLMRYIEEQELFYVLCKMQCSQCYLNCSKFQNHSSFLQIEINQKDQILQNLIRKYQGQSTDLMLIQKIIAEAQSELQQLIQQIASLNKEISYLECLKEWIGVNNELNQILNELMIHEKICDHDFKSINFMKLLIMVQQIEIIFDRKSVIIYSQNNLQTQSNDILLFLMNSIPQLQQQQLESNSQLEKQKQELKMAEQRNQDFQNKIEKAHTMQEQQQQIIIDVQRCLSELNEKQMLQKIKIEKLIGEIKILENQQVNQRAGFDSHQHDLSFFVEQAENIKKSINLKIKLCNDIEAKVRFSYQQIELLVKSKTSETEKNYDIINTLTNVEFLSNHQNEAQKYKQLLMQKQQINEEVEIVQQKLNSKSYFQLEQERIRYKFKVVDLRQFNSFEEVKVALNTELFKIQDLISSINSDEDFDLKESILSENSFEGNESQQFKELFITRKKKEIEQKFQMQEQVQMLEIQEFEKERTQLSEEIEFLRNSLDYYNLNKELQELILNYQQVGQQNIVFETELHSQKQNLEKVKEQIALTKLELKEISEFKQILKEKISSQEQHLIKIENSIEKAEQIKNLYISCSNKIEIYLKQLKQKELLEAFIDGQEKQNITDNPQNEEFIETEIKNKNNALHHLKQLSSQKQCIIEQNLSLQNDVLLINKLKIQLDELKAQEKQQHSCLRKSHQCSEYCEVCKETNCEKKAGHQQNHLCDLPKHFCTGGCSISECIRKCQSQYLHNGEHNCGNQHQCKIPCQYCGSDCQFDYTFQHEEHICQYKGCIQKCSLCGRSCMQAHNHSRKEGFVHFCENIHSCEKSCNAPGVCFWEYIEEKREWKSSISSFIYTYFKQIDGGKQKCSIQIQSGEISHGENHSCKLEAHKCGEKCPECDGLCTKEYGHLGFHFAKQHRNKDHQVFTLTIGQGMELEFNENLETHKYQVGDTSSPETCTQSCARRSRAHFHLMKCQGGEKCLEKINQFARHQKDKYQGFEEVEFDEVLCVEYWKLQQWEHPLSTYLEGDKFQHIRSCNFYCPFCPSSEKSFCSLQAWHSESYHYKDHSFPCGAKHNSKEQFPGLDVVFVIDSTGSMSRYIDEAKLMIKNIIKKAKASASDKLRFGIIAYRDHPPQDNTFVTIKQNLGKEADALKFLDQLKADGGGDYPEAVLDGLQEAVKLDWIPKHDKMIFLIGDAPPHGKIYSSKSNWPDGCPCGIKESVLFRDMQKLQIQLKILQLDSGLNLMIQVFQKFIKCEILEQSSTIDFVQQVVNKVCQQMEMREITYRKD